MILIVEDNLRHIYYGNKLFVDVNLDAILLNMVSITNNHSHVYYSL